MSLRLIVPNFGYDLLQSPGGANLPAGTVVVVDQGLDKIPTAPPDAAQISGYVTALADAGYTVWGYLGTNFAADKANNAGDYGLPNIEERVDAWFNQYSGGRLSGIYFDQGSEDPTNDAFYQALADKVRPRGTVAMAFADATHAWIAGVADVVTLWERNQDLYLNASTRPDAQFHTWVARAEDANSPGAGGPLAWCGQNVINTVGACADGNVQDVVNAAFSRDIGYLQPYDVSVEPTAVYDHLSPHAASFATYLANVQDLCQPIVDAINTLQEEEASGIHIPGYDAQIKALQNKLRACRCLDRRPPPGSDV